MVHFTLISCFSCIYLPCKRFIWGRQQDIFGLLSAQETRAGSLSTFRSVVLCLQLICKCSRTQCKGHALWRNHICLIVLEEHQLCWGGLKAVTVMTLEQFWGAAFHVWTMLLQYLFYWGARNSSSMQTGRYSSPQLVELWDFLPFLPFMNLLLFSIEWDSNYPTLIKKKGNLDATSVFAALNWVSLWEQLFFSKIRKCRDEQQYKKINKPWVIKNSP